MNIAITGGYGSGKSCVSRLLTSYLSATFTNTDLLCRILLEPDEDGFIQLQKVFGDKFISCSGTLDRALLRHAAFTDSTVKEQLEKILHPLVRDRVRDQIIVCKEQDRFLVVEVPLLFEVGWQDDFDITVLVRVDSQTSIQRAVKRDAIEIEEAERIIGMQLPMSCKEPLVDYIIDNNDTFTSTVQQTAWLATLLCNKKSWD
ncbi:MAG: dephospho-CoA kinase [Desulforhopalus sp.]